MTKNKVWRVPASEDDALRELRRIFFFSETPWENNDVSFDRALAVLQAFPQLASVKVRPFPRWESWLPIRQFLRHPKVNLEVVKFIYELYPGALETYSGQRLPLHEACESEKGSSKDIVAFLAAKYPESTILLTGIDHQTPLHMYANACHRYGRDKSDQEISEVCDLLWDDKQSDPPGLQGNFPCQESPLSIAICGNCRPLANRILSKIRESAWSELIRIFFDKRFGRFHMGFARGLDPLLPKVQDLDLTLCVYDVAVDVDAWQHVMSSLSNNTSIHSFSLCLPSEIKQSQGDALESLIRNNSFMKKIRLAVLGLCDDNDASEVDHGRATYFDVLAKGLRHNRTLEKMSYVNDYHYLPRNTGIEALLLSAPKVVSFQGCLIGETMTKHDSNSPCLLVSDENWAACRVEQLDFSSCHLQRSCFDTFFKVLSAMPHLRILKLEFWLSHHQDIFWSLRTTVDPMDPKEVSAGVLSILKQNRLSALSLDFCLIMADFCRVLDSNTSLKSLSFRLGENHIAEGGLLADSLKENNTTLAKLDIVAVPMDEEFKATVIPRIGYYLLLNKFGRRKIRFLEVDAEGFVNLLSGVLDENLEPEIPHGEVSVMYGLLREMPSIWVHSGIISLATDRVGRGKRKVDNGGMDALARKQARKQCAYS